MERATVMSSEAGKGRQRRVVQYDEGDEGVPF
jgi:hypothetical protein